MADLDVLVDAGHAPRAFERLLAAGYTEHPDPIGEHADHHLPMLCDGDVTVELHVEPLVSRWRALVPAAQMLRRAMYRPTGRGVMLLADDTDTFVHLVAHAQLQEETHTLLGLPLRALLETARIDARRSAGTTCAGGSTGPGCATCSTRTCTRRATGSEPRSCPHPREPSAWRAAAHTRLVELGVVEPAAVAAWTYAVRVPRSFSADRMHAEFGGEADDDADVGRAWLWQARARHAARRMGARLGRHEEPRTQ